MTLDPRLRHHIDRIAADYEPGSGNLERVLGEGRRRVRRRRIVRAIEGTLGMVALVVAISVVGGFGQTSTPKPEALAIGTEDVTRGGITVQRFETASADLFGPAFATETEFVVLVMEQPGGLWNTIRGWFGSYPPPLLTAYRTTDGRDWTRTVIPDGSYLSEDFTPSDVARTPDGTITVVVDPPTDLGRTEPPSVVLYTTGDDLSQWIRQVIDITPDRALPDGLIWADADPHYQPDLVETGGRVALITRIAPSVDPERFQGGSYDHENGWSLNGPDGITIPIEAVYPNGDLDVADTVIVVQDGAEWERLLLTGLPTDDVLDLGFRDGVWYAAVSEGTTRTNGMPLTGLYRLDEDRWSAVASSLVGSPLLFDPDGLLIEQPSDAVPMLGGGTLAELNSEILVAGYDGSLEIRSLRSAQPSTFALRRAIDGFVVSSVGRTVAIDSGPYLDLDMDAFDVLPPEAHEQTDDAFGTDVTWYRERLDEGTLVPMAYRDGYLLALRDFRPLEWWVFDLQR